MTTLGDEPHNILVNIGLDFQAPASLPYEDYIALAKYLGFTANLNNPFKPYNFFKELDGHIPAHHRRSPAVSEVISAVGNARNVPEAEKIYFKGWRENPKEAHVSEGNYWKTCSIVGEEAAKHLRQINISSCWSDNPNDENLPLINQYTDYL